MELSQRLTSLRKQKGWSQEQTAQAVGVSRQSLHKWERGTVVPSTDYLIRLAKVYGLTLDELVNGEETPPQPTARKLMHPTEQDIRHAMRISAVLKVFFFAVYFIVLARLIAFVFTYAVNSISPIASILTVSCWVVALIASVGLAEFTVRKIRSTNM